MTKDHIIIFTDLDGTLLDAKDYSFGKAQPALRAVKENDIPIVICTSKTRSEVEYIRNLLDNSDPFVVENGGAVCVPKDYFQFEFDFDREIEKYFIVEVGTPYNILLKRLEDLKNKSKVRLKGFSDMTVEEIASTCDLTIDRAKMAKAREYDEPFLIEESDKVSPVEEAIDFNYTTGDRFWHITDSDKGRGVSILIDFFKKKYFEIVTVGLGDRWNDLPMLSIVDFPILVRLKDGSFDPKIDLPKIQRTEDIGPAGWNEAVLNFLSER